MITFTALRMTEISVRYRTEFSPNRTYVQFGLADISPDGHIKPEDRARIAAGYPEHEREARVTGEPMLGEGKIFQTPEAQIIEDRDPLEFANITHWRWGAGMDLGIRHPWAYVLECYDTDADVIHLVAELRITGQTPGHHVAAIRQLEMRIFGRHMDFPTAWPADAGTRDKGSGEAVIKQYKQYGLRVMNEHATHQHLKGAASNSLEGGLAEQNERERNGKWKVARSCVCYLEERRTYHRRDGEVVKMRDDTLSAGRYGMMMKRKFLTLDECGGGAMGGLRPPGTHRNRNRAPYVAAGTDFDVFSGE